LGDSGKHKVERVSNDLILVWRFSPFHTGSPHTGKLFMAWGEKGEKEKKKREEEKKKRRKKSSFRRGWQGKVCGAHSVSAVSFSVHFELGKEGKKGGEKKRS